MLGFDLSDFKRLDIVVFLWYTVVVVGCESDSVFVNRGLHFS
jgi:hypothetical protein